MKQLNIEEIIKAVDGTINNNINTNNIFIKGVSTDTRTINFGDLFIPIVGENFDAHNFIESAFEKGAICCLSEKDIITDKILIKVDNTKVALKKLAKYYRSLFNIKVVAITGSVGKTTTKDIVYSVLSQKYNVIKTEGNFNNEIGLPLTIFNIKEDTEVVVLEMGMNNFNEIHNLSEIAKPDIATITNIGFSHIENLGSREGILRAKYEIFDFLNQNNGIKILNADDDMLITLNDPSNKHNTSFYSISNKSFDVYTDNIIEDGLNGIFFDINFFGKKISVKTNIPSLHIISNFLCATLIGHYLNLSEEQIKYGLENFKPTKMRMDIIKNEKYTLINDVYNASPSSMKSSLDVLSKSNGRKVAILGDMFELGTYSENLHYQIGQYAVEKEIDVIICIGELSQNIYLGALQSLQKTNKQFYSIYKFKTQEEFFLEYKNIINTGDFILVKASRGMHLEKTVDKIMR